MAVPLKFTVTGLDEVLERLGRFDKIGDPLKKTTEEALLAIHAGLPSYPTPSSGSRYRRTGTLGRSITSMGGSAPGALSEVRAGIGPGVVGVVGSAIVYAPYVIDENRQAFMHRGRWWTLQGEVIRLMPNIIKLYQNALIDLVR